MLEIEKIHQSKMKNALYGLMCKFNTYKERTSKAEER